MANDLVKAEEMSVAQKAAVMLKGDLASLNDVERIKYYNSICDHLGLNPATRPFEYLVLNGKTVLYARKDATEQLRASRKISLKIIDKVLDKEGGTYTVQVEAKLPDGRSDEATGSASIFEKGGDKPLTGEARSNAIMKAETKAKRRATLSICGLGFLDETEIETIPSASSGPPIRPDQSEEILTRVGNDPKKLRANLKPYNCVTLGKLTEIQAADLIRFLKTVEE